MLSAKYQTEQGELAEAIQTLQERLQKSEQESFDAEQWIALIKEMLHVHRTDRPASEHADRKNTGT